MISIGCLIYKSPEFADFVYDSLHEFTPQLRDGSAEFFFVVNDPEPGILEHLESRGYRHHIQENTKFTEEELLLKGIRPPDFLNRVYRANNRVFSEARGETVVLVHSDMAFSPGWLDALLGEVGPRRCVVSQLIEPVGEANLEYGSYVADFGHSPRTFEKALFLDAVEKRRTSGVRQGGMFIPFCAHATIWNECGGFSEGNPEGGPPADRALRDRYARLGVETVTALDSIVYHFGRGELRHGD